MNLKTICVFFGKYTAVIVLVVAALALFLPKTCLWIQTSWINYLLMIVMFGMGLTLRPEDFKIVFQHPKNIILGCIAQFTIMPLLAFLLGNMFSLETGLLAGVMLVGICPGGTSSNVITYLSKGDVALSVGMTTIIIKVIIIPIAAGFIINRYWGEYTDKISEILPAISVIAIALIVGAVISHNAQSILATGIVVFAIVILLNLLGYVLGFLLGTIFGLSLPQKKALSIEIGMQNSGLATSLAGTAFPNLSMATVPGAIFSVWHNISGAILANIYLKLTPKESI